MSFSMFGGQRGECWTLNFVVVLTRVGIRCE